MATAYRGAAAIRQDDAAMHKWFAAVSSAAASFDARWTLRTLDRVDPVLAGRLREQRALFDEAMLMGTAAQIEEHGAAMCRGYRKAVERLERADVGDEAYQLGSDPVSGIRVAIGIQKAAAARVRELYGDGVSWISADECAALIGLASADAVAFATAVKKHFPGAVLTEIRKAVGDGDPNGS